MGQDLLCIIDFPGTGPGSFYDSLLSDNNSVIYKSLNMLKTYPWEEPLRNISYILAPAVKDVILMAQDYILRVREIIPEFG